LVLVKRPVGVPGLLVVGDQLVLVTNGRIFKRGLGGVDDIGRVIMSGSGLSQMDGCDGVSVWRRL